MDELNRKFGIPGVVSFESEPGGLTRMAVAAQGARAEVYLHGGHVTAWQPPGQAPGQAPVLWVSRRSRFERGSPIRGGVPVCFPWFGPREGDPRAPAHGFARLLAWDVESVGCEPGGPAAAVLVLRSGERTAPFWSGRFELRHRVTVGRTLTMALETRNVGAEPFTVTEALHSYFGVSDVRSVTVRGLEGTQYLDKVEGGRRKDQGPEPITFAAETDRVYVNTAAACILEDPGAGRTITVAKSGSQTTVVWNPWTAKAARMDDFGDDEWPGMVCIETANAADNALTVPPGGSHTMEARISVQ